MQNQIDQVLASYPVARQNAGVVALGSAGGLSGAKFWKVSTDFGQFVLRRWPAEHPTADQLRFIHDVLGHAAKRGIEILPLPVPTSAGDTYVSQEGHLWELAPWLAGKADYHPAPSDEKLRSAMRSLAEFHQATADYSVAGLAAGSRVARASPLLERATKVDQSFASTAEKPRSHAPAIIERLAKLRRLAGGHAVRLADRIQVDVWPALAREAIPFLALVDDTLPRVIELLAPLADLDFRLQPVIRDVWHDHLLFTQDRVTGLIDFGALRVDTPAVDVARLLGSLAGGDAESWQDGIAAYDAIRRLTGDERRAVIALDMAGVILGGCNWLGWVYLDHRVFDRPQVVLERFDAFAGRLAQFKSSGRTPLA